MFKYIMFLLLREIWINVTTNEQAMSNSQNQPKYVNKFMFFTPKKQARFAYLPYNVKKDIRGTGFQSFNVIGLVIV